MFVIGSVEMSFVRLSPTQVIRAHLSSFSRKLVWSTKLRFNRNTNDKSYFPIIMIICRK